MKMEESHKPIDQKKIDFNEIFNSAIAGMLKVSEVQKDQEHTKKIGEMIKEDAEFKKSKDMESKQTIDKNQRYNQGVDGLKEVLDREKEPKMKEAVIDLQKDHNKTLTERSSVDKADNAKKDIEQEKKSNAKQAVKDKLSNAKTTSSIESAKAQAIANGFSGELEGDINIQATKLQSKSMIDGRAAEITAASAARDKEKEDEEKQKQAKFNQELFKHKDHLKEVSKGGKLSDEAYDHHKELFKDPEYLERLNKEHEVIKTKRKELEKITNKSSEEHKELKDIKSVDKHMGIVKTFGKVITENKGKNISKEDEKEAIEKRLTERRAKDKSKMPLLNKNSKEAIMQKIVKENPGPVKILAENLKQESMTSNNKSNVNTGQKIDKDKPKGK